MARVFRFFICVMLVAAFCCGAGSNAIAAFDYEYDNHIEVFLHGCYLTFDVDPQLINGRVMVPMRVVFQSIGANVDWNAKTKTITATRGSTVVKATIGSRTLNINGSTKTMDVAPVIINGRTLVPVRFVSESFGYNVNWNSNSRAVTITGGNSPSVTIPTQLAGRWRFVSGNNLYFIGRDKDVEFYADGRIYSFTNEVFGSMIATGTGWFAVRWFYSEYDTGFISILSYSLSGNRLTIVDIDGDKSVYERR